jgi:DNA-binding NarL/FixJ family response regulator
LHVVQTQLRRSAPQAVLVDLTLTKTEMRVLHLILDGRNNRDIALALHRSPRTVEVHRSNLMRKLGVSNIVGLLRRAADAGLLHENPPGTYGASTC